MPHCPDSVHIDFRDELGSEWRAACGVEHPPEIEMLLHHLLAFIRYILVGIDSIVADRYDNEAVAGKDLAQVVIPSITWDCGRPLRTGPRNQASFVHIAGNVRAVHEHQQR